MINENILLNFVEKKHQFLFLYYTFRE